MKRNELLNLIEGLSHSQGFYGRLLRQLIELKEEDPENYEQVMTLWEKENFKTELDFILYLES